MNQQTCGFRDAFSNIGPVRRVWQSAMIFIQFHWVLVGKEKAKGLIFNANRPKTWVQLGVVKAFTWKWKSYCLRVPLWDLFVTPGTIWWVRVIHRDSKKTGKPQFQHQEEMEGRMERWRVPQVQLQFISFFIFLLGLQ